MFYASQLPAPVVTPYRFRHVCQNCEVEWRDMSRVSPCEFCGTDCGESMRSLLGPVYAGASYWPYTGPSYLS